MDFTGAIRHAEERLTKDLPPNLFYHGLHHTRDVVVPAVQRLSEAHHLSGVVHKLLMTAAWYHDLGFIKQYKANEAVGAKMAEEILPQFGFAPVYARSVAELILSTRLEHEPRNLLEKILTDADLDMLGHEDFLASSFQLREELRVWQDVHFTDIEWYEFELAFIHKHRYLTAAQRAYRNKGKVKNFLEVAKRLSVERSQNLHLDALRTRYTDTTPFRPI